MANAAVRKPLIDRLRATDLEQGLRVTRHNRVVILTHRVELEAALAQGYSLRRLHTQLRAEGIIGSDYSSFRRAARTAGLGDKQLPPVASSALPPAAQPHTPADKPWVFERPSDEPRVFVHNPKPSKEPWG